MSYNYLFNYLIEPLISRIYSFIYNIRNDSEEGDYFEKLNSSLNDKRKKEIKMNNNIISKINENSLLNNLFSNSKNVNNNYVKNKYNKNYNDYSIINISMEK